MEARTDQRIDYAEIVPGDDQDALIQLAESIDQSEWAIGRYVSERYDQLKDRFTRWQICLAVAYWTKQEPNTIRDWEYCARYVPQEVIDEFPSLGRSHFRLLIPYCEGAGDYVDLLNAWMTDPATQTHSVRSLARFLTQNKRSSPGWYDRFLRVRSSMSKLKDDKAASPRVRLAAKRFLSDTRWDLKD